MRGTGVLSGLTGLLLFVRFYFGFESGRAAPPSTKLGGLV